MGEGIFNKFKNWITEEEEDFDGVEEEYEQEDEEEVEQFTSIPNTKTAKIVNLHTASPMKVVIVEPKKYEEVTTIADHLKQKKAVIVNLENLNDPGIRKSIFEFMNGAVYVLDGGIQKVSKGIQLIYNDFEATEYEWESILDKDILEINHCREGREGSRLLSGSCLYLGEGDLSIHTMDNCASEMSFPLKHYRGISVVINLTTVSKNSPEILMEAGIDILAFRNKFCASGDCFIMRAKDEIEHIFSELYSIPDCLQKPYMKLKVQELLLFLYTVDAAKEKQRERYTSPHVEIVKEIHKKLVSDLQKRPTIEELSKEFLINTATLKNTFKGIYGQPIGTYMKEYRMKRAAILLRQTQATIAEISNQVGYENQSKFATAFRDVMKITPAEYRKQDEAHLGEDFSIEGISI